jgi:outer membrane receptor protein involved in Fe transport
MPRRLSTIASFTLATSFPSTLLALQQEPTDAGIVIIVDSLDRSAFRNLGELLQARIPGLHVARTGDGGMRWFMRGPSSIAESTPLVLIDDVPINVAGSAMRDLGTRPPILDEIDIEDVDRIEVLTGPATATRYGTGSGNGVIRILTFAPRAQRTSFRIATSASTLDENVTYPANATRAGIDTAGAVVRHCTLQMEANDLCTPTGPVTIRNVLASDSPFERAIGARASVTVASGSERLAWRGGATLDREGSTDGTLADQRVHLRGAGGFNVSPNADFTLRGHWMRGDADLPSLNEPSLLSQGLLARADTAWPGFVEPRVSPYHSTRYGVTGSGRWRPRPWLDTHLTGGGTRMVDENDLDYTLPGGGGFDPLDVDSRGERRRRDLSVRLDAAAQYRAGAMLQSTTVTLEHWVSKQEEEFARILTRNGMLVGGAAFAINQRTAIAAVGLTQHVNLVPGLEVVGGLRLEQVRVSDVRWDTPVSPRVSLTWDARRFVPSEIGRVRLRAALGDVPNVPQTTQILFLFPRPSEPEPPKAEVTRERELGIDATVLENRVGLSLAWYNKRTSNVGAIFLGGPSPNFARIEVLNRGIEGSLHARIFETSRLAWKAHARYAYNHNESKGGLGIAELGETGPGTPPFFLFPSPQWVLPGRPLGAQRLQPIISIRDLDGDGLLDDACYDDAGIVCEVVVSRNGGFQPAYPPTRASLETSFRVGAMTLSALVDHRSGHVKNNATMQGRCVRECQALYDPATSLRDQAEAMVATAIGPTVQDASFTKLREVSLRFDAPASWARALGATRLTVSLAGRNVATWSDYGGLDPETTSAPWIPLANFDNAANPLPRRFVIRAEMR